MKTSKSCLKCASRKLYVIPEVNREHHEMSRTVPVHVTAELVFNPDAGILDASHTMVNAGRFEAWVCAACGYTEWYATRLGELAKLAEKSRAVRVVEGEGEGGPYR